MNPRRALALAAVLTLAAAPPSPTGLRREGRPEGRGPAPADLGPRLQATTATILGSRREAEGRRRDRPPRSTTRRGTSPPPTAAARIRRPTPTAPASSGRSTTSSSRSSRRWRDCGSPMVSRYRPLPGRRPPKKFLASGQGSRRPRCSPRSAAKTTCSRSTGRTRGRRVQAVAGQALRRQRLGGGRGGHGDMLARRCEALNGHTQTGTRKASKSLVKRDRLVRRQHAQVDRHQVLGEHFAQQGKTRATTTPARPRAE